MTSARIETMRQQLSLRRAHSKAAKSRRVSKRVPKQIKPLAIMRAYEHDLREMGTEWRHALDELIARHYPLLLQESRVRAALDMLDTHVKLDARSDRLRAFRAAMEASRQRIYNAPRVQRVVARMTESLQVFNREQLDRQFRAVTGFGFPDTRSNFGRMLDEARAENVRLIENLTRRQRDMVEEHLARASRNGTPIVQLAEQVQSTFGLSERQSGAIARDQTFRINAELNELRQREAGIDRYTWSTSLDERVRPDHAALEGMTFSFDSPPIADEKTGERANPGEIYNCFPGSTQVELADDCVSAFRHWYRGELVILVSDSGETLKLTPNHPVLSAQGWVAANLLKVGDHIFETQKNAASISCAIPVTHHKHDSVTSIDQVFKSFSFDPVQIRSGIDFHGDVPDGHVDVVGAASRLLFATDAARSQTLAKLDFSYTNLATFCVRRAAKTLKTFFATTHRIMRSFRKKLSTFWTKASHTNRVRFRSISDSNTCVDQSSADHPTVVPVSFAEAKFAGARNVLGNDPFEAGVDVVVRTVVAVRSESFSGHVYNLETKKGWYVAQKTIVHNCRCVAIPVFDFMDE